MSLRASETIVIQILGDYGTGKTHALRHVQHRLEEGGWFDKRVLPIFIENPGENFSEFYERFLYALKIETISKAVRQIVGEIVLRRANDFQAKLAAGDLTMDDVAVAFSQPKLNEELVSTLRDYLRAIGKPTSIREDMSDFMEHLARVLANLVQGGQNAYSSMKWLTMQDLYKVDREILGVPDNPGVPTHVALLMASMITLVARAKALDKIVLLVDEVEDLRKASGRDNLARCLRTFVDIGIRELVIILGTSYSIDVVFEGLTAFLRRVHITVTLPPINEDGARELVAEYMRPLTKGKGDQVYGPFTPEAIKKFNDEAKGKMSVLITILSLACELYRKGDWTRIDTSEAVKVIAEAKNLGIFV